MDRSESGYAPSARAATPRSGATRALYRVFLSSQGGFRAGWRFLLFAVIWWLEGRVQGHVFPQLGKLDFNLPSSELLIEGVLVARVVIATGVMAILERRSLFSFGFQGRHRLVRCAGGAVTGFASISLLILVLWAAGFLTLTQSHLPFSNLVRYAFIWGCFFTLVAVFEESLLRGYAQHALGRGVGFWWAALLLSALFGALHLHNPGETPIGIAGAVGFALIFCLSLWYTGSLWWALGFHAAWDWAESFFYGVADSGATVAGHLFNARPVGNVLFSGGSTGPEGSVLVFVPTALLAAGMWAWWGRQARSGERDLWTNTRRLSRP